MDIFGDTDPRKMPGHLFRDASFVDYSTAIKANIEKQDFSVCPRHWYIDADLKCVGCRQEFTWTAEEQRTWFEGYRFWVGSYARHCRKCRAARRHLAELRAEYDANVAAARDHGSSEQKIRIIEIVSELEAALGTLPEKMIETRHLFGR